MPSFRDLLHQQEAFLARMHHYNACIRALSILTLLTCHSDDASAFLQRSSDRDHGRGRDLASTGLSIEEHLIGRESSGKFRGPVRHHIAMVKILRTIGVVL